MHKLLPDVIAILERRPFLFEIAMHHKYREDPGCKWEGQPTMCCDGQTVTFHPEVMRWTKQQRQGVIIHEWSHTAHSHHLRGSLIPGLDHKQWNIACDAVVNPMVKSFGWPIEGGVDIPWATGMNAEQVYARLMKRQKPKPAPGNGQPKPGDGKPEPGDGPPMPSKPGPGKPGPMGQPKPGDQPGEEEVVVTKAEAESKALLARMAASARQAGCCPAGLEISIKNWLEPKADWRAVLREFCTRSSRDGWSYERTNASYAARGLYVPGRKSRNMGHAVIVMDTSGSLYDKQTEIMSEAYAILNEARPELTVLIDCDARVHRVIELKPGDPLPTKALGGGGTDFRPAFREVKARGYQPEVMIFITDLCGTFPEEPPEYPVLWALINSGMMTPPWGRHVMIEG
jgi:predicted metal-dependent peptidase